MYFARRLIVVTCAVLAHTALLAGSYPAGSAIQNFELPDGAVTLGDDSTIGSDGTTAAGVPVAGVYNSMLRLADKNTTNAIGSFKLPDLDPGNVLKTFDMRFWVAMGTNANTRAGEGWSINFGTIPLDNGTGEGGFAPLPGGLTVSFDTGVDPNDPPSIEVFVSGVSVGKFPRTFVLDGSARLVVIHWDTVGLDLSFDNATIFADLATPGFSPVTGATFAFSARTTDATMDVFIDSLRVTTQPLPVLNTGGPIISEFVANNDSFEDEFGQTPSWIELFNGSPETVDFTGWYLTDSKKNLKKWKINGLMLTPYNYQIIFASGKDRQLSSTSFPHATFSLANNGGYVALVRPDGTVASSYDYGPQDKDVSFGEQGQGRLRGYMYPASPGTVNTAIPAQNSFSDDVQFSHPGGFILQPVTVTLSVPNTPGEEIRYTLDRTLPGTNSLLYTSPIVVTQTTMIRARSFSPNHLPGEVIGKTFVLMDSTLSNYNGSNQVFDSNLPLVYLDSFGVGVDGSTGGTAPFRSTYALIISPDPITGRASLTNAPDYSGPAGAHVHGESSASFDQRTYALQLWDENGGNANASLNGMPSDSSWILYGPFSEKALMRNKLIYDWMIAARGEDGTAVRSRFVELFFNQSRPPNGQIGYSTYRGVYVLMEKIHHGKNRVPIQKLNAKTVDPNLITGGYIIREDKPAPTRTVFNTPSGIGMQSFDPDTLNSAQLAYIKSYLANFEKALNGPSSRDFVKGYQAYIDPDTFIDSQWILEFTKQVDGYVFSTYWFKDRGARLRAGPIWDFNIALGNASYAGGDSPVGWYNGSEGGSLWYPRLHADPEYRLAFWDRYWQLRSTIWDTNAIMAKIDENMRLLLDGYNGLVSNRAPSTIQNPIARHYRRWPILGRIDWPNPNAEVKVHTYQAELDYMRNWIITRVAWLDDQSMILNRVPYRPPMFSQNGGAISQPLEVALTPYQRSATNIVFPSGDIYYTIDNSDPRLPGGAISEKAIKYRRPLPVQSSFTLNARLFNGQQWSPLASATYLLDAVPASASNLVVSEIMYSPAALTAGETNAGLVDIRGFEFVELRNIAGKPIDLTGVKFTQGLAFDFDSVPSGCRLLQPGASAVLVSDKRAFIVRYPNVEPRKILGQFQGHLDGNGETITLADGSGQTIRQLHYDTTSPWPETASSGQSIILNTPASNLDPNKPASWSLSVKPGGTPGESGLGADTFSGDPSKDTDGDGVPDLFEFFAGTDPEDPGSAVRPTAALSDEYMSFRFTHRAAVQGLRMSIEHSADLATWTPDSETLLSISSETNRDGTVTDQYRSSAPVQNSSSSFYRLRLLLQ